MARKSKKQIAIAQKEVNRILARGPGARKKGPKSTTRKSNKK